MQRRKYQPRIKGGFMPMKVLLEPSLIVRLEHDARMVGMSRSAIAARLLADVIAAKAAKAERRRAGSNPA